MKRFVWLGCSLVVCLSLGCGDGSAGPAGEPRAGSEPVLAGDPAAGGALDAVATTAARPRIVDLVFAPSKFVGTCAELVVTVTVADPDPARLVFTWTVESPAGQTPAVRPDRATLRFSSKLAGDFQARVEICPPPPAAGPGCARLTFPIHVVPGPDADHDGIADLCEEACIPACGGRTCGVEPACGLSCGSCPADQICTPLGFCAIPAPH